jgi:RND family efflux transporter MFP subunit
MTTIAFLAEWAVRSSALILVGALLLWVLRVKDASVRLAAWTVMLCCSLAIPALTAALPELPFPVVRRTEPALGPISASVGIGPAPVTELPRVVVSKGFDWVRALLIAYALVAGVLLVRLGTGLVMSGRLRRGSRATGQVTDGIEIRESELLEAPVALGILRPVILLPVDWREWDGEKLNAVLTHERSHIRRRDPAVQFLSALHRALLWHSPLSWFLHQRLVRVAEEASDDAAVASACDRASYAKVLLEFMQRGVRRASWLGVPMARYGRMDERIHRILDGAAVSRKVTRFSVAAIVMLGLPLVYVVAALPSSPPVQPAAAPVPPQVKSPQAERVAKPEGADYLAGLGAVSAYTVTVKSRIDGQLMSVNFKEGDVVQQGQVVATIDPQRYQLQLLQAEGQLARDRAHLGDFRDIYKPMTKQQDESMVKEIEGSIKTDQAKVDEAKLQLSYTQIASPITGVAGLRLVDPGNIVHAADTTGIVIINQLKPIAVLFSVSEDRLPQVLAHMKDGVTLPVEAWSRDQRVKIATGRLTAVDNQIDTETGTVKLKAEFGNKDGALFPNQFVNVRVYLSSR